MTYTKQVREYCENHKGTLIDISKVKDEEFAEIPYKTRDIYCKIHDCAITVF